MAKNIKDKLDKFLAETFQESKLEDVVGDRFGRYSKYIIQERAIPDIRDGLKPVQRRILYAMNELKITANAPYKKSARITGEVMGKYHPHGDSSIYEALVRMSQSWKMGVSLIDMHGNNGSMDGDGPAAMRYTEARMSKNAEFLLKDIDKNTVPFIPNFDEEEVEPTVLPAKFPNLLVNGCMGISSGYATYIPTHNFNEVINATIARLQNPEMTLDDLLEIMPGPDFPTGGIILGTEGIREAFLTGAGAVIVRSKYTLEDMGNGCKRVVVTEIPYDTIKSKTVEKIEQLRMDGKIPDVAEVRDESGREGLRISIDLKKNANVSAIMAYLFKNTDLQVSVNYNMVSICERRPMRLGVIPILDAYINHYKQVVTNRTNFDLIKARKRLHIVEGLVKMISVLDEVIKTIRASKNKADSKQNLIAQFGFTEEQAEAIVMMQLYKLSNQDITILMEEDKELHENIATYEKILSSERELIKVIIKELTEVGKAVSVERRTEIDKDASTTIKFDEADLISKEQVMISISRDGYMKRASIKAFNAARTNGLKENDAVLYLGEVSTLDTLLIFTSLGNFIYLPVHKILECKFKDVGTYINSVVAIAPKEKLIRCFVVSKFNTGQTVLLCTAKGAMKQTLLSEFNINRYTKPVRAMKLSGDDTLVSADIIDNPLEILVFTKNCEGLRFRANEISLYGCNAGGVKAINLRPKDAVVSAFYANKEDDFLLLSTRYTLKRMRVTDIVITRRARAGSTVIKPVKTNPIYLVDAAKMTPNQFRENVRVDIRYLNGNDGVEARSLKYNVSDTGRSIQMDGLTKPEALWLPKPAKPDDIVSGDYLIVERQTLFNFDDGAENEKPLMSSKNQDNILDELDKILATELQNDVKKQEETLSPKPFEEVKEKQESFLKKPTPLNLWDLPPLEEKEEASEPITQGNPLKEAKDDYNAFEEKDEEHYEAFNEDLGQEKEEELLEASLEETLSKATWDQEEDNSYAFEEKDEEHHEAFNEDLGQEKEEELLEASLEETPSNPTWDQEEDNSYAFEEKDEEHHEAFNEDLGQEKEEELLEASLEETPSNPTWDQEEDNAYAFEERDEDEDAPTVQPKKEVKVIEGEKYIVKETKSSLFIREKDPIRQIDEGEDEEEEIPYQKVNIFD
ncbi:MAG: DNA topoisomerase IV subunit A [Anaeroplasma bactoclasticum]|nr:DNA topoisomerase IV subunit A [Anaeroplasma bactoclasticum]